MGWRETGRRTVMSGWWTCLIIAAGHAFSGRCSGEFCHDGCGAGSAEPSGSCIDEGAGIGESFDTAGSLELNRSSPGGGPDGDVGNFGACCSEAGGSFDKVGASVFADFQSFKSSSIVKKTRFDDYFDKLSLSVGEMGERGDFGSHYSRMTSEERGIIHHDIHLMCSGLVGSDDLVSFGFGGETSAGKPDHGADAHAGASEDAGGQRNAGWVNHDTSEAVLGGFYAELLDVGLGCIESEVGRIEHRGQLGVSEGHGGAFGRRVS